MQPIFTRILGYFCISLLGMAFECEERFPESTYTFREKIDLFPTQKQYKVGDTLWIRYTNSTKSFFDSRTNQQIPADSVFFRFYMWAGTLQKAPLDLDSNFCDYLTPNGLNVDRYVVENGTVCQFDVGCTSTTDYNFTIAIILKQKGIYSLNLPNGKYHTIESCSNRITRFPQSDIEFRYNIADGNKDIYLSLPAEKISDFDSKQIDDKQMYIVNIR